MATSHAIRFGFLGCFFVVALGFAQATASAETLSIQYTGLDINYNGSVIQTPSGNPDSLSSLAFKVGDVEIPPVLTSGIAMNLSIPDVLNLPVGGGTVTSAPGGSLALTLPGGDYLNLEIGEAEVVYVAMDSLQFRFVLGAGSAEVLGQSLPVLGFGDEVSVSFSTQLTPGTLTHDGSVVTGFKAKGTGEISGPQIPEPTTVAVLLSGLLCCLAGRGRRS